MEKKTKAEREKAYSEYSKVRDELDRLYVEIANHGKTPQTADRISWLEQKQPELEKKYKCLYNCEGGVHQTRCGDGPPDSDYVSKAICPCTCKQVYEASNDLESFFQNLCRQAR